MSPVALITGAARGIGAAVARSLADTHELLLGGRDAEALQALAKTFPNARAWPVELTDPTALAAATEDIDRLDVLVHSAGIGDLGKLADATPDVWRRTFDVNVFAVAELTRLLLPALRTAQGHVVLINSGSGLNARANWGVYAASKFALRAFADSLRDEEERAGGLRVTTVYPGRTDTDMQRGVRTQEGGEYEPQFYLEADSVGRAVAAAVLASPDAHITEINVRPRAH
jgi:NADP-dependent 3-hydroxy acid dehydrogenase YdfG